MTGWVALGPDGDGLRACAMDGGRLTKDITAPDRGAALRALRAPESAPVLRLGEGAPARLPAPVLPETPGRDLPGFTQDSPPDVIGAWVRVSIAGFLAAHPGWNGVICTTDGDASHWVHLSAGEAVSAQSFLTPRLIRALGGAKAPDARALADTLSRPERLAAHLRAAEVSGDAAALTGHLLGAELAAARPYWLGQQVAVLGHDAAAAALAEQAVPCTAHAPDAFLAPGLAAIGAALGF